MRIVGGELKRRHLASPRTRAIRPMTDRLREALFSRLEHVYGLPRPDTRVLDLFAGTGALGFEALSRGASACVFVETGIEGRSLLRDNVEALGVAGRVKILKRDATRLGARGALKPFDLVFVDPPYGKGLGEKALASARRGDWLAPGALCVWEETAAVAVEVPDGFRLVDEQRTGQTDLRFLEAE